MESLIQEKSSLKILHLYSDWRWTGPAEPVLQICKGLRDRGHNITFAFRSPPVETENITIEQKVKKTKIKGMTNFSLDRYVRPLNTIKDLIQIPIYLKKENFDIIHMHLSHDHVIGTICAKILGKKRPILIRTFHKRSVLKNNLFNRLLLKNTDGYLFFTEGFRKKYTTLFKLDPNMTSLQPMTVDINRFNPNRHYKDMRKEFGIPKDAIIIGTIGRFQKYRRIDWFLNAARLLLGKRRDVYWKICY